MTDLSPAARAVLTAVTLKKYDVPPEGLPDFAEEMAPLIAAALRAAADQVVPQEPYPNPSVQQPGGTHMYYREQLARWEERKLTRRDLLAIAAELEGQA